MSLLDSLLAFALTLAALATVVTLIIEIIFRFLRLKTMDQVTLMEKLVAEARPEDSTGAGTGATNEDAVQHVLTNPFVKPGFGWLGGLFATWRKAGVYYKEVSLEHTLRRLLESLEKKNQDIADAAEELQAKADIWARKYDEYRSALATRFKARAQILSLAVGVFLAFAMNINGLRVFEVYLQDPELRERVIESLDQESATTDAPKEDPTAEEEALQKEVDELRAKIDQIDSLDLPIGWAYFPYCSAPEGKDPTDQRCPTETDSKLAPGSYFGWVLQVLITGILIGLGAPFWYDVARRLAAVRAAFGGAKTAEARHRGADATDGPDGRETLIKRIVKEFTDPGPAPPAAPADGNGGAPKPETT
ncbi:hypothetical protein [Pelagibius sp.]|uniref:hypothetical protein n=1 Tax=Pelagibius sp. TaxID=1931238 RepID=UPI00261B65A1|nr:hypothetical protein [Pelagibius sp.]